MITMHVEVARDTCIGSGLCAMAVPEVFDQDEVSGGVILLDDEPPNELHATVRDAAQRCPVQAIVATSGL